MSGFIEDDRVGIEDIDSDEVIEDYLEDAELEDIDLVIGIYREDGEPVAVPLSIDLANDLYEFIRVLRRLPGDSGSTGFISIDGQFFVIVRVRGRNVQIVLSDVMAALDWPIARDVAEYFDTEIEEDEEPAPLGDLEIFADYGISEFELETICCDLDLNSDELVLQIAEKLKFGTVFAKVLRKSFAL